MLKQVGILLKSLRRDGQIECTAGQQFTLSGAEVVAVPQLALSGAEVEAVPLRPGQAVEMMFEMADICHVFGIGHSIMIQVQGSWFPLAAMNPQRFLPNPYAASVREYMPIRITILPGSELSFEAFTATTE